MYLWILICIYALLYQYDIYREQGPGKDGCVHTYLCIALPVWGWNLMGICYVLEGDGNTTYGTWKEIKVIHALFYQRE